MNNLNNKLIEAAKEGNLKEVERLLQKGADVHAYDDYALRWASNNGHLEVVRLLLQNGADVHAKNDYALRWASYNGHLEVVKLLLQNGADVHVDNDFVFRWASRNGHLEVVKLIEEYIKDPTVIGSVQEDKPWYFDEEEQSSLARALRARYRCKNYE